MSELRSAASVARFAALLADRTRAAICLALLDGRAWTCGELARHAGVRPSTASEHLSRLVAAGLLAEQRQGRHRYVRLADHGAAQLVEDLAVVAGAPSPPASLRAVRATAALAAGRTCYDHLAGRLGVDLFDGMVRGGLLSTAGGLVLTPEGTAWLAALGAAPPGGSRRPLVRTCLDWTERRSHLGGAVGAAVLAHGLARGWVEAAGGRAVRLTDEGREALGDVLSPGGLG